MKKIYNLLVINDDSFANVLPNFNIFIINDSATFHKNFLKLNSIINGILFNVNDDIFYDSFLLDYFNNPYLKTIPIFIYSNDFSKIAKKDFLKMGAIDCFTTYQNNVLNNKIYQYLNSSEKIINSLAFRNDNLTNLLNKEAFDYFANSILDNSKDNYQFTILDINNFKLINSIYGKKVGDNILISVAKYINENIIIKSEHNISCRLYGDQFIILSVISSDNNLDHNNLITYIKKNTGINISFRAGIIIINAPVKSGNVEGYYNRAKLTCDSIKKTSGLNYKLYKNGIFDEIEFNNQLVFEFENAIKNKEFVIHFQPKFNLINNTIVGAEALIRWQHPTKGFLAPKKFIPIFEESGQIEILDNYVAENTCLFLKELQQKQLSSYPISINISRYSLYNEELSTKLLSLVTKYNLDIKKLHLEITETYAGIDFDQLIKSVKLLKNAGFTIELDDFGTGYSTLSALDFLPIDIIKLDMQFVKNMHPKNLVKFSCILSDILNIDLIAEGVETKEEISQLISDGCKYGQGYFCSKAISKEKFLQLLITNQLNQ